MCNQIEHQFNRNFRTLRDRSMIKTSATHRWSCWFPHEYSSQYHQGLFSRPVVHTPPRIHQAQQHSDLSKLIYLAAVREFCELEFVEHSLISNGALKRLKTRVLASMSWKKGTVYFDAESVHVIWFSLHDDAKGQIWLGW